MAISISGEQEEQAIFGSQRIPNISGDMAAALRARFFLDANPGLRYGAAAPALARGYSLAALRA